MSRLPISVLFLVLVSISLNAQTVLDVENGDIPENFFYLLNSPAEIREDDALNEHILDLVGVSLQDSVITRKTERHQFFSAAMLRMFGYYWKTINWKREKYIGTAEGEVRVPGEDRLTEYDVNWNLIPNTSKYLELAVSGFAKQREIGRLNKVGSGKKPKDYYETNPKFSPPTEDTPNDIYDIHCELTPLTDYRPMLNTLFYPCISGHNLMNHPNFGMDKPSIGLYGPWVSDCNHLCHPEIHPYEWIWWLNTNPKMDAELKGKQQWIFGLFREGSNRMPHWSKNPRTGQISIPFLVPIENGELLIDIEHLVYGPFDEEYEANMGFVPESALSLNFAEETFTFSHPDLDDFSIKITTIGPLMTDAAKLWFSDLTYAPDKSMLSGNLHIALSVQDLYTAKITVE